MDSWTWREFVRPFCLILNNFPWVFLKIRILYGIFSEQEAAVLRRGMWDSEEPGMGFPSPAWDPGPKPMTGQ